MEKGRETGMEVVARYRWRLSLDIDTIEKKGRRRGRKESERGKERREGEREEMMEAWREKNGEEEGEWYEGRS